MIIKKYIVDNIQEAINKAKYDLGPDAMILTQTKIKEGKWYHILRKEKLEVVLGIEDDRIERDENITLNNIILKNPIFRDADSEIRNKLSGYIKLNNLDDNNFSIKDSIEFINYIYKGHCLERKEKLKKINIFVGPTGVGKTTTIAKIAAKEKLINKKEIGILTMDTYKIGAIEQLKSYANILDIPFSVVENIRDIKYKIDSYKNLDMVFIDTAGICQNNVEELNRLKKYISSIKGEKKVYLTISISTDEEINSMIIDKYNIFECEGIIFTKFDELMNYKKFWSILKNIKIPVEYLSIGQEIPEDIKSIELENMISYIEDNIKKEIILN